MVADYTVREGASRVIPFTALAARALDGDEKRIRAGGRDGGIAKPTRYRRILGAFAVRLVQP